MASSSVTSASDFPTINDINQFPDEILIHIFELLPVESILTCEQVSERWKRLARDPYVWSRIEIVYTERPGTIQEENPRSLQIINSHRELIHKLKLQYVDRYNFIKSILTACRKTNLISLKLWMCRIREDILDNLKAWPYLRKLSLRNSMLLVDSEVAIRYDQFEYLQYLELSDFGLNNNNCSTLLKLKHLRDIIIDKIKDLDKQNMIDLIESKTEILETLFIYGRKQVDDNVLKMLSECPNLKTLSIKFCEELTDRGLITLINLKQVEHLQIWNNTSFTETCLLGVLGHPSMFRLRVLSLNRIENITPPIIDIMCSKYTNLRMLALYKCPKLDRPEQHDPRLREKFENLDTIYN